MLTEHREVIHAALRDARLERLEQAIVDLARPCARFATRRAAVAMGCSKLGGQPDLPHGMAWPTGPGRSKLTFLAQIDLAEVARLMSSPLPADGLLLVFFDRTELDEGKQACRVIHARGDLERRALPDGHEMFHECAIDFTAGLSVPTFDSECPYNELLAGMSDDEFERLRGLRLRERLGDVGSNHQLLGYPRGMQGDVLIRRAAHDPRFASWSSQQRWTEARRYSQLLGIDTDEHAGLNWVDMGTCWFLIAGDDLARHELSRVTSVVQFC